MARNRRRNSGDNPIGIGTTARNRKKRKSDKFKKELTR